MYLILHSSNEIIQVRKKTVNDSVYIYQASVLLGLEGYLVALLAHADVVLDELSLVDDLLHDEADDDSEDREGEEQRGAAALVVHQGFRNYAVDGYAEAGGAWNSELLFG